ncbi:peptide ABC transporter substrate-binding protein [Candidatus Methylacidithermus pantelleriae]|uniref:peptide ABC transporter substrate-binding protein n=1 Tax=Candidatus Methylacidithermus pantelleriae TaxID=2744239 RepID=UPI001BD6159E|nr:peptide ABC transporter substrate-binding protein [Candidatus Methylacidithermus pantelleriae]
MNGPEPESLDPHLITGQPESRLCEALFEGLVARDAQGRIVPGVAESWELSPDGRTYTFHLRSCRWSDGHPLTAAELVASWQRAISPKTASRYADLYDDIENARSYRLGRLKDFSRVGVRAPDARTVIVRLEHPVPYFLDLCAQPVFYPVPIATVERWKDDWTKPRHIVSNGAYTLVSWRINDRVCLRKNPLYWRANEVHISRIDALAVTQATTAFNLFYTSGADLILDKGLVPTFFLESLSRQPYFHSGPFFATYFYRFNVTRWPLSDPRVRKALAMSINKNRLVTRITRAGERIAPSLTPPGVPGYTPPKGLAYNPERARQLLAEAGFPGGKGFPRLSILYNAGQQNEQIATEIQAMWREVLGIDVELRNEEWKVYLGSLSSLQYDIARSSWVGDYLDPNTFLSLFLSGGGNNNTGWSNRRYDALLQEAAREATQKRRFERLREAEELLLEEAPIAPLYFYQAVLLYHADHLGGIGPNLLDHHPLRCLFIRKSIRNP